jgi:manganese oxidase
MAQLCSVRPVCVSRKLLAVLLFASFVLLFLPITAQAQAACSRTLTANVVALDQPFFLNRLGALESTGMIFALQRDVVPISGTIISAGNVQLRSDKRPRPLVLRMNVGDCLRITFTNLLAPVRKDLDQVNTRNASIHVMGMQLVNSIGSDGSNVGLNGSSFAAPGGAPVTYTLFAQHEGGYVMYSTDTIGGEGDGGQQSAGLFGAINVEPSRARWYRSQVTKNDLDLATTGHTSDGHPIVNYEAVYPTGSPLAGQPILDMLVGPSGAPCSSTDTTCEIIKTDLTAMITGPLTASGQPGRFPTGTFSTDPQLPDREQPFREFTIMYHDEIGAIQAFPEFFNPDPNKNPPPPTEAPIDVGLIFTLSGAKDGFAINYGVAGIGAEVLANRLRVGPMWNCTECKYEEFFLSSWTIGDPAQIVDIPANTRDTAGNVIPGAKATKVLYPDDPSNVYHSYIADHTKFRILHGGVKEHHIHHQHAHQWVHTPNSDNSSYDDSQAIGPGAAFTLEMTYNGGGNRNQVVGDSIFHCHFYPHFGQGMWSLWRTHDVFEAGTQLDTNGRPVAGSRAYPDGEIAVGSPIPALVPLPTKVMAPIPAAVSIVNGQINVTGTGNPGYPFFVPATAGHRPPHPPLFTEFDGGLPRHVITGGSYTEAHTRLDFHKTITVAQATQIPENGTTVEQAAMAFHEVRNHPSFIPETGAAGNFVTNGLPRVMGAPYADPCINDAGQAVGTPRLYKSADIQLDVKYNKAGWHFPQHRMSVLWDDVTATRNGTRPPQPLFFRANTNDCITFKLTSLIPNEMQQDDFQVHASTDVMGQHIHLVKFDVTTSDGAGNGWNYEEGAFTAQEVQERIHAIDAPGGTWNGSPGALVAKQHPFFTGSDGLGAQTVVERWYADPTLNNAGQDRTLRTVFTHDHFGPSNHQQAGLYAGLLIEPQNSTWQDNESGAALGGRDDGGPTTWEAIINNGSLTYREFMMEFQDYQLAYTANGVAVNPPARVEVPLTSGSTVLMQPPQNCPVPAGSTVLLPPPCPEAISADDVGTMTVSYRNEPIPLRVRDPGTNTQASGDAGDLAQVYSSTVTRADAAFNVQPNFYPPLTGDLRGGDPFTPVFRVYDDDRVQVRSLVGATEEGHNFTAHGIKWLREPSDPRSGWRASQMMGISEHFEFDLPPLSGQVKNNGSTDFLYQPGASDGDQWNGLWGLIRAYDGKRTDLAATSVNSSGTLTDTTTNLSSGYTNTSGTSFGTVSTFSPTTTTSTTTTTTSASTTNNTSYSICPSTAPVKNFDVTAINASALPGGKLVYNTRTTSIPGTITGTESGPLSDPTAILYVYTSDLTNKGFVGPVEPLILRVNSGDCINITVRNQLSNKPVDLPGYDTLPMIVNNFNANQVAPSTNVGLHPELLAYNLLNSEGANIGLNPFQTPGPNHKVTYQWYAGHNRIDKSTNSIVATPVEFGAVALTPADPIKQASKGAVGALIVEPLGATWTTDTGTRASATVNKPDGTSFREFVLVLQNDVNLRYASNNPVSLLAGEEDPEDTGQSAFNYRTEPLWFRMGYAPETLLNGGHGGTGATTKDFDFTNVLSNTQVGGDPQTPVFIAKAGTPVRMRLVHPVGNQRNNIFQVHGHVWQEEPYNTTSTPTGGCYNGVTILGTPVVCSTIIADNPTSEWQGSQMGVGPSSHFDLPLINGAGGNFKITGDYLYRTHQSFRFDGGLWGILRVTP